MDEQKITVISKNTDILIIPTEEYTKLKQEKEELLKKIKDYENKVSEYEHNANILRQTIVRDKEIIDTLKKKNEELTIRLQELEEKNHKLENKVDNLEEKLKVTTGNNIKMQIQINSLTNKALIKNIIIALNYVREKIKLEDKLEQPLKEMMYNFRKKRNEQCHLISQEENEEIQIKKFIILLEIINNLDKKGKRRLNKEVNNNLLNIFKQNIKNIIEHNTISEITEDEKEELYELFYE
jgi:chaperonin cofactor prefoldin